MRGASLRWYFAALIVSMATMTSLPLFAGPSPTPKEYWQLTLLVFLYSSFYIIMACLIASFAGFVLDQFDVFHGRCSNIALAVLGGLSGAITMLMFSGFTLESPELIAIATIAGSTGGFVSRSGAPLWSRRELLALAVGILGGLGISTLSFAVR